MRHALVLLAVFAACERDPGGGADLGGADLAGAPGGWVAQASLPGAQQEIAVVAYGDEIWLLGGFNGQSQVVRTVLAYEPANDRWRSEAELPEPLHHANAAVVGDRIYVVGFLTGLNFAASGKVFVHQRGAGWSELAADAMPAGTQRGAAVAGAIDGKIYVAGGFRAGQAVADVSVYDPVAHTWTPRSPMPVGRDHAMGGVIDGRLYVAGGRGVQIGAHTPRLDLYDPVANQWTTGPDMPTSRGGAAGAVAGGRLVVVGGEGNPQSPRGVFDDVEVYDPAATRWDALTPMKTPRHGMGAAALGKTVYVPGGADQQAFGAVITVESLTLP
jgi:N-acetylneuraminic acid mutarotase